MTMRVSPNRRLFSDEPDRGIKTLCSRTLSPKTHEPPPPNFYFTSQDLVSQSQNFTTLFSGSRIFPYPIRNCTLPPSQRRIGSDVPMSSSKFKLITKNISFTKQVLKAHLKVSRVYVYRYMYTMVRLSRCIYK